MDGHLLRLRFCWPLTPPTPFALSYPFSYRLGKRLIWWIKGFRAWTYCWTIIIDLWLLLSLPNLAPSSLFFPQPCTLNPRITHTCALCDFQVIFILVSINGIILKPKSEIKVFRLTLFWINDETGQKMAARIRNRWWRERTKIISQTSVDWKKDKKYDKRPASGNRGGSDYGKVKGRNLWYEIRVKAYNSGRELFASRRRMSSRSLLSCRAQKNNFTN